MSECNNNSDSTNNNKNSNLNNNNNDKTNDNSLNDKKESSLIIGNNNESTTIPVIAIKPTLPTITIATAPPTNETINASKPHDIPPIPNNTIKTKKKRRNKSELGKDFVAPDGGWGWMVVLAAGCSNLCTFPVLQQFGLLFRDKLAILDISSSQITTIININAALTSIIGLANGPVFRRFTFRQVSFCGALIVSIALFFTSIANSFIAFVVTFSVMYGAGIGMATSANSLALNTYFKEKRRFATGFSWSATALGPIITPHVITLLMQHYGVQGTVLIFCGFALNAIACSLVLQPVQWHVKKPPKSDEVEEPLKPQVVEYECKYCQSLKKKNQSVFSSQYLYNSDDVGITGYEIIDPGTPMLSKANDGWYSGSGKRSLYGSKMSLTSNQNLVMSNRPSYVNLGGLNQESRREKRKEILPNRPSYVNFKDLTNQAKIDECATEDCPSWKAPQDLQVPTIKSEQKYMKDNHSIRSLRVQEPFRVRSNTFNEEKEVLRVASKKLEQYVNGTTRWNVHCTCEEEREELLNKEAELRKQEEEFQRNKADLTLWQKFVIFFDLDLLRDHTYVILLIGLTIANFAELNFSVLTPFVLGDFNLTKPQVAMAMSLLGAMDIFCRFSVPFVAGKIGWENRTFFIVGVMGMAAGRIVLAHFHSYNVVLVVACWIGFNKGLRTVFMALVIPSHIPLDRLPGATGIHLLFSGCFYFLVGPVVGLIRDSTDYPTTLHCLNLLTYATAISWTLEKYFRERKQRNKLNST